MKGKVTDKKTAEKILLRKSKMWKAKSNRKDEMNTKCLICNWQKQSATLRCNKTRSASRKESKKFGRTRNETLKLVLTRLRNELKRLKTIYNDLKLSKNDLKPSKTT